MSNEDRVHCSIRFLLLNVLLAAHPATLSPPVWLEVIVFSTHHWQRDSGDNSVSTHFSLSDLLFLTISGVVIATLWWRFNVKVFTHFMVCHRHPSLLSAVGGCGEDLGINSDFSSGRAAVEWGTNRCYHFLCFCFFSKSGNWGVFFYKLPQTFPKKTE